MTVLPHKSVPSEEARQRAEEAWSLRRSNPQRSLELGREALALARSGNDTYALARSLQVTGTALRELSRFAEALEHLHKALPLYEEINEPLHTATTLRIIGATLIDLGEHADALAALLRASDIAARTSDVEERIACLMNIASIYGSRNEPARALEIYAEAEDLARRNDLPYELGIICRNMGVNACRLGNNERAIDLLRQALTLQHRLHHTALVAGCLESLGSVFMRMGHQHKALRYYTAALRIQRTLPPGLPMAVTLFNIGTIYDGTGRADEALAHTLEALQIAETIDARKFACDMHERCAALYEEHGDTARACHHLRRCLALTRELSELEKQKAVSLYQVRFETERHRSRQEELQRRLREAEHTALRSQMNPHFISNALNAIQSLIIEGDNDEAQRYLTLFARLIRRSFEQTRSRLIPLAEELLTLQLYLDIEKLRFEREFDCSIRVTPPLDPLLVYVPPMLLQPFAENAIMHGILPSGAPGLLLVTATLLPDAVLRCTVEDNGVGLAAAAAYSRRQYTTGTRSLGMTLIRERLALLEETSGRPASFSIAERNGTEGSSGGTVVELCLPAFSSPHDYSS